jgi:phage terminase small subunit
MDKEPKKISPTHEKFAQHYAHYGVATQAYMFAFPNAKYKTARELGMRLLKRPEVIEKIEQLKEEFATKYNQSKEGTIRDLIDSAEQAKEFGQFAAYAKMRDMIIKMCGFYEPDKQEIVHKGITINYNKPNDEPRD